MTNLAEFTLSPDNLTTEAIAEIFAHMLTTGPVLIHGIETAKFRSGVASWACNEGKFLQTGHMTRKNRTNNGTQKNRLASNNTGRGILADIVRRPDFANAPKTEFDRAMVAAWASTNRTWPRGLSKPIELDQELLAEYGLTQKPDSARMVGEKSRRVMDEWAALRDATYFKR